MAKNLHLLWQSTSTCAGLTVEVGFSLHLLTVCRLSVLRQDNTLSLETATRHTVLKTGEIADVAFSKD